MRPIRLPAVAFAALVIGAATPVPAQEPAPAEPAADAAPAPEAAPAAEAAPSADAAPAELPPGVTPGPSTIAMGHDLTLALGEPYLFADKDFASKMLEANGNFHNDNVLGLVVPKDEAQDWFVVVTYQAEGYIKDDETIDAAQLLDAMKEGVKQLNEERADKGFKPLSIDGWGEEPHYDRAVHHLVWGLNVGSEDGTSLNYNTRVLGRKGFVSLNLVTDPAKLGEHRPAVADLLASTSFDEGARYEDYKEGTDKVAEYGLAGLILGGVGLGAAKLAKVGFLAAFFKPILAGLIAFKKLVIVGAIALFAWLRRFFGGKSDASAPPPSSSAPPPLPQG